MPRSADDRDRPGAPGTRGPQPSFDDELREFLTGAPEALRGWAGEQLALLDAAAAEAPVAVEPPPAELDPADLALAELGEDDDEDRRGPKVHTPMDKAFTPVAQRKRRSVLVPLAAIAVVAALVYGVFRIGLPAQDEQAASPEVPAATDTGVDVARMAELEAKLIDSPDDVAVNLELGVLLFNAGEQERAEQLWTRVTELDPRNPQAWFNLGFLKLGADDLEGARADWEMVLEVAPESDLAATVQSHLDAFDAMAEPDADPTED